MRSRLTNLCGIAHICVAIVASAAVTSAQNGPWSDAVIGYVRGPRSVTGADLDGDGDLDALSASSYDDKVAWFENRDADGSHWEGHVITASADSALAALAADLDGDGDLDVVAASYGELTWHENTVGDASAWLAHSIVATSGQVRSPEAADVDGDGDLDVVAVLADGVAWFENAAANGSLWRAWRVSTSTVGSLSPSAFAADVDGDGDIDVVSAAAASIAWHENVNGDGSAWIDHRLPALWPWALGVRSVSGADADGDGDLDVLCSTSGTTGVPDSISWFENTVGNGSSWFAHTISTSGNGPRSLAPVDLDHDGDLDVLSALGGSDSIAWYENEIGDGSAWRARSISVQVDGPLTLFAGDVDGDGDTDVLSGAWETGTIAWHENLACSVSGELTEEHVISTSDSPRAVVTGDVDGDGDVDAISMCWSGSKVSWHENLAGDASTWTDHVVGVGLAFNTVSPANTEALSPSDLDGDGDLDLLVELRDETVWFENTTGDGSTWARNVISSTAVWGQAIVAADVDGDGDTDALSVSHLIDRVLWHENVAGDASVWAEHTVTTAVDGARGVAAADVDGDGDMDVLSASEYFGTVGYVGWHENVAGDGSVWADHYIHVGDGLSVRATDIDGDGDVDAVTQSLDTGYLVWHENDLGDGSAWSERTIGPGVYAKSLGVADVDGDGDVDVLCASQVTDVVEWYENAAGDGSAWAGHSITASVTEPQALFADDLDSDGDIDVLLASAFDDQILWGENTRVSTVEVRRAGNPPNPLAFLPGVTQGPSLGALWDPVIDHATFAPGAVLDFVILSGAPANVPTPMGTVLCDRSVPGYLRTVTSGTPGIPFSIAIPAECQLLGRRLCAQGGSIDAGGVVRLANALDVTIGTH